MASASGKRRGFKYVPASSRMDVVYNDSAVASFAAAGMTLRSGKALDLSAGTVTMPTNLATGYMPLDITTLREMASNDTQNTATGAGGFLAKNTTPILERINGATDKALQVHWAANNVDEVQFAPIVLPPDLDDASPVIVNLRLAKGTNTDTTTNLAVNYFQGVGDTNAGTSTAALAVSTEATYSVTIAAADVQSTGALNIALIPAAHANDTILLRGASLTYSKKTS